MNDVEGNAICIMYWSYIILQTLAYQDNDESVYFIKDNAKGLLVD